MSAQVPPQQKPKAQPTAAPPIRIDSTIELAWGLTLNFSSDPNERAVGANFLKWFDGLRQLYKNDSRAQAYLDDLSAVLTGYLRTAGYERDVFVRQLNMFRRIRDESVKSISEVADPSSVSIGSFLSKLAAFLGVGTLAGLVGTITNIVAPTTGLPFNLVVVGLYGLGGIAALMLGFWVSRSWMIQRVENGTFDRQAKFYRTRMRPQFKEELFQFTTG